MTVLWWEEAKTIAVKWQIIWISNIRFRSRLKRSLPAWRIRQSSPTGCLPLCSVQTPWLLSRLIPACCLQEKMARPFSPVKTPITAACPLFFPTQATVELRPPTDTAQVTHRRLTNPPSPLTLQTATWTSLFCPSVQSSTGLHVTGSPQQSSATGRTTRPLPDFTIQHNTLLLEQQPCRQASAAFTHPDFAPHPRGHLRFQHLQGHILVSDQRWQGESPASGGPQGRALEPAGWVGGQQQLSEPDTRSWGLVHSLVPLPPTYVEPLQLLHEWAAGLWFCYPLFQPRSLDQPLVLPQTPQQDEVNHSRWRYTHIHVLMTSWCSQSHILLKKCCLMISFAFDEVQLIILYLTSSETSQHPSIY